MYYYFGAIPICIVKDFELMNKKFVNHANHQQADKLMSPLVACWKYHSACFSSLISKELDAQGRLVRMFFYNLEQQMNAISFQLCLLDEDERPVNRFDSFYLPQLIARSVYCICTRLHSSLTECNLESSFQDISEQFGKVVEFLVGGMEHVRSTKGFDECVRRLTILIVSNECNAEFKQALLLIYLSCLCDRYVDIEVKSEYPLITYTNELARLISYPIDSNRIVEFVSNDFYKNFEITKDTQLEHILDDFENEETLENNLIAFTQYSYFEKTVFAPQLRQLSFPFLKQTPFGDCQELNLFEMFINNFIFNHQTKKYDLSLLPDNVNFNKEIERLLLDYDLDPKHVNCLSFRSRYHTILQGKPEVFQYVNASFLSEPEKDYEVDVSAFNILAYCEWLFGISLEKKAPLNKFLNFDSYLELRKSKQDNSCSISYEDITILKQARLRFCLEKGFKKEKKQLELAFKELSAKLTTKDRSIEIKMDRTTKQNHNLIIAKYHSLNNNNLSYEIIADQYGAHVATYRNAK